MEDAADASGEAPDTGGASSSHEPQPQPQPEDTDIEDTDTANTSWSVDANEITEMPPDTGGASSSTTRHPPGPSLLRGLQPLQATSASGLNASADEPAYVTRVVSFATSYASSDESKSLQARR